MKLRLLFALLLFGVAACEQPDPAPPTTLVAGPDLTGVSFDVHKEPG